MDDGEDRRAQEDEMEILTEILDADCFTKYVGSSVSGKMKIKLRTPGDELKCRYVSESVERGVKKVENDEDSSAGADSNAPGPSAPKIESIVSLKHVPPLTLHFTLPLDYPSTSKPIFTLSSEWLHRNSLSFFCGKLDELWEENKGMAILFTWHSFLQEDAFSSLGINSESVYDLTQVRNQSSNQTRTPLARVNRSSSLGDKGTCFEKSKVSTEEPKEVGSKTVRPLKPKGSLRKRKNSHKHKEVPEKLDQRAVFERIPESLITYLIHYEKEEIDSEFRRASHMCTICLSEKRGSDSMLFECQHCFCKECLREFFSLHITEGSLDCVKCPDVNCKVVPTPHEVKAIVSADMFERYDTLLLSKSLDSMSDILHCPRITCNRPVMFDPSDKLAKCASCDYAFCSICKMVYHGVEPCRFRSGEAKQLYEKYTSATSEEKKKLEKTYGKKQLDLLIQQTLSEEWVNTQAKPCPHCKVPIEKFEGCNKVTCFKCATYFCWICATQLDKQNPYFHFNNPASPCFNNLFTNMDMNEPQDDGFDLGEEDSDDDSFGDSDFEMDDEELLQEALIFFRGRNPGGGQR